MELNKIYFFTASVYGWKHLFKREEYKLILINSLKYLIEKKKIKLYSYVIMPNHIHLIWEMLENNGRESANASFMKFSSHEIQGKLRNFDNSFLSSFKVNRVERRYQFWQENSLSIELFSPEVIYQKMEYIHENPCKEKWYLVEDPLDYRFSSSRFYYEDEDEFSFLTHIGERI